MKWKLLTHLSCISVWTRLTSKTLLTLGLKIASQSEPSFLRSLGTSSGSSSLKLAKLALPEAAGPGEGA